jgi:hypothetical protein
VDNDKKNARSVENSKNKGAFLKSLNQRFMWTTGGAGVDNNRVFNKKFFQVEKKRILF